MLNSLRTRAEMRRKAGEIYGAIVTLARCPDLYAVLGVPDTPSGRYEMVALHLSLVLERLRADADKTSPLPRWLVEAFVSDMDDSLRELATGDLAVPRKVKKAAAGLYERSMVYRSALEAGSEAALADVLIARTYAGVEHPGAGKLARYVVDVAAWLAAPDAIDALIARRGVPRVPGAAVEAA